MSERISMIKGAKILVDVCANVQPNENVLIITDRGEDPITDALAMAVIDREAEVVLSVMTSRKAHGFGPPKPIAEAMLAADVIFAPTYEYSISFSQARANACARGARYVNMVGYRENTLKSGGLFVDFLALSESVVRVADLFTKANEGTIISKNGERLSFGIKGNKGQAATGLARDPGESCFPPVLGAAITPAEGTSSGKTVIDGSIPMGAVGILSEPIELIIDRGCVAAINGGYEIRPVNRYLSFSDRGSVFEVTEIGIGLNPKCNMTGTLLEDLGVMGSVHIGITENTKTVGFDEDRLLLEFISTDSTLKLDNETIIDQGVVILDEWREYNRTSS